MLLMCCADDGDFVNLQKKHNFSMAHFGMMLGMVRTTLTHLQIQHCNDWFSMPHGALSAISCLPALRMLRIEDLHCRVGKEALAELAALTQVSPQSLVRGPPCHGISISGLVSKLLFHRWVVLTQRAWQRASHVVIYPGSKAACTLLFGVMA